MKSEWVDLNVFYRSDQRCLEIFALARNSANEELREEVE